MRRKVWVFLWMKKIQCKLMKSKGKQVEKVDSHHLAMSRDSRLFHPLTELSRWRLLKVRYSGNCDEHWVIYEHWSSHVSGVFLDCDPIWTCRWISVFQRCILSLSLCMLEAVWSSKTLVQTYKSTWHQNTDHHSWHQVLFFCAFASPQAPMWW